MRYHSNDYKGQEKKIVMNRYNIRKAHKTVANKMKYERNCIK